MATISAVSAPHQSSALQRSTGGVDGSCERGTHRATRIRATITTGTFTRNTEPHQNRESRSPPTSGPTAVNVPPTPDQIEIARPRSCSGKMLLSTESVDGIVAAPPTPITPRAIVERGGAGGERGGGRRDAEDHQADHEHALAPAPVADDRERQQQAREHQAVGAADPLQAGFVGVQAATGCSGTRPRGSCCR